MLGGLGESGSGALYLLGLKLVYIEEELFCQLPRQKLDNLTTWLIDKNGLELIETDGYRWSGEGGGGKEWGRDRGDCLGGDTAGGGWRCDGECGEGGERKDSFDNSCNIEEAVGKDSGGRGEVRGEDGRNCDE